MMSRIVLCADSETMRQPALLGLSGENLAAQDWLALFTSAEEARGFLRNDDAIDEVWVASSDDVDPINLAAAVKRDRRERGVYLLAFQGTGSLWSRASAAGIDATLSHQAFVQRYTQEKRRRGVRATTMTAPLRVSSPAKGAPAPENCASPASLFPSPAKSTPPAPIRPASPDGTASRLLHAAISKSPAEKNASANLLVPAQGSLSVPVRTAPEKSAPSSEALTGRAGGNGNAYAFKAMPNAAAEQRFEGERSVMTATSASARQAFLLPVVSGSGGAGKSTVAVLAAVIARKLGYETLLLDFDLQFGDMREMLGVSDALAVDEGLAAPARLGHLVGEGGKPALLAAPRRLEAYEAIAAEGPALLDCLMPRFDVIVANTGAAWREEHALLLERSSKALFLVDQRASSLRACKHAFELCARCGIATSPFVFVANRCMKGAPLSSIDVSCAMQGAHAVELREGGRDVEELLSAGMPLDLVADRNDLCISLEQVLADLLPGPPTADEGLMGTVAEASRGLFRKRRGRRKRGVA